MEMTNSFCSVGDSGNGAARLELAKAWRPSPRSNHFILEAFDRDLWCPVAQTLFHVADIDSLRSILGAAADEDPELRNAYHLDDDQLATLVERWPGSGGWNRDLAEFDQDIAQLERQMHIAQP